jgi:hypothetical protein
MKFVPAWVFPYFLLLYNESCSFCRNGAIIFFSSHRALVITDSIEHIPALVEIMIQHLEETQAFFFGDRSLSAGVRVIETAHRTYNGLQETCIATYLKSLDGRR